MTSNYSTQACWWGFHHDQEDYEDYDDCDDDDWNGDVYYDDNLDDNDVVMTSTPAFWYHEVSILSSSSLSKYHCDVIDVMI